MIKITHQHNRFSFTGRPDPGVHGPERRAEIQGKESDILPSTLLEIFNVPGAPLSGALGGRADWGRRCGRRAVGRQCCRGANRSRSLCGTSGAMVAHQPEGAVRLQLSGN